MWAPGAQSSPSQWLPEKGEQGPLEEDLPGATWGERGDMK